MHFLRGLGPHGAPLDHKSVEDEDELRRCRVTSQDRIQGSAVIREIN